MRHSHTSRGFTTTAKTIIAFVGLVIIGACADSISAPSKQVSFKHPAQYDIVLGEESFVYNPEVSLLQRLDNHVLVIPAGGICDPATSSYGPEFWNDDCDPLTHEITITATTLADSEGHPYVNFEPALRFVPTKETNLYLYDGIRTEATIIRMDYCNMLVVCVDESLNDSSLVTHRIGESRFLGRRIKHFSGYMLGSGESCPGSIVDDGMGGLLCMDGALMNRSGYMLASGLGKTDGATTAIRHKKAKE